MKPGDSFLLYDAGRVSVATCAHHFAKSKNPPWRFSVLNTPDGYRCWRVS
jgi:hypothetical protein